MTPLPDKLLELAKRVDRNVPRHGDPEQFHVEKSEIVSELKKVSREMGTEQGA